MSVPLRTASTEFEDPPTDSRPAAEFHEAPVGALIVRVAQVQYERRRSTRARLPGTELALLERDLIVELRRRGVLFGEPDTAPRPEPRVSRTGDWD